MSVVAIGRDRSLYTNQGEVDDTLADDLDDLFGRRIEGQARTQGDIIYAPQDDQLDGLPVGQAGQVLGINADGTLPQWRTPSTYLSHDLLDGAYHPDTVANTPTQGDLIVGNATPAWDVLPIGGAGAGLFVNAAGVAPFWFPLGGANAILGVNPAGNQPAWSTTVTYTDATRTLQFTGGDATIIPAAGQALIINDGTNQITSWSTGLWDVGRVGRRLWEFSQPDATGRYGIELWPDNFSIITATGTSNTVFFTDAGRVITLNIPGGGGVGNDTAPGFVNFAHTVRFEDTGFLFAAQLLVNAAVQVEAATSTVGPIYLFLDQYRAYTDGSAVATATFTQHNAMRAQPRVGPNINGGNVVQTSMELYFAATTIDATVGTAACTALTHFTSQGVTLTAGGTVGTFIAYELNDLPAAGITTSYGIWSDYSNADWFIFHSGTSPSQFAGDIRMNDSVDVLFGTTTGVAMRRTAVDTLTIGDQALTTTHAWDYADANSVVLTGDHLQVNLTHWAFGTTIPGATENWFGLFAPAARAPALNGDYADILFTAGGNLDLTGRTMTQTATWILNEPSITLGGGTTAIAATLIINNAPTEGTDNYALRIGAGLTSVRGGAGEGYEIRGTASGTWSVVVPATVTSYVNTWPSAVGAANTVLADAGGTGTLSWSTLGALGGVTGSGANTQVVYWTGASTIAGDAGLTYDAANDILTVTGASANTGAYNLTDGTVSSFWDISGADARIGTSTAHDLDLYTNNTLRWFVNATTGALIPSGVNIGSGPSSVVRTFTDNIRPGTTTALTIERQDGTAWATLDSGTGNTVITIATVFNDAIDAGFGTGQESNIRWDTTQTNDGLMIGIGVGSAAQSGNVVLTTNANRGTNHAYAISSDPRLYIASATTPASNFISFHHNGTDGRITTGAGDIVVNPAGLNLKPATDGTMILGSDGNAWLRVIGRTFRADIGNTGVIARQDGTAWATLSSGTGNTTIGVNTRWNDDVTFVLGTSDDAVLDWSTGQTNDGVIWGIPTGSAAQSGNIVITDRTNAGTDHAYAVSSDPRLYLASATTPASNWLSAHHDGTDGRLTTGAGNITLAPAADVRISGAGLNVGGTANPAAGEVIAESGLAVGTDAVPTGGGTDLTTQVNFSGNISPAALGATENNFAPTGVGDAVVLRLTPDPGNTTITGIDAQNNDDGRLLILVNIDTVASIGLSHDSGSSLAANRILAPGGATFTISPTDAVMLVYDGTSSRWRVVD